MKKVLILSILMLTAGISHAASRPLAGCDDAVAMQSMNITSFTATEFFAQASTVAWAVNNTSGTYIDQRRNVCFENLDASATDFIYVSTFSAACSGGVCNGKTLAGGWAIPGGPNAECFNWGSAIKTFLYRAAGLSPQVVTGLNCK